MIRFLFIIQINILKILTIVFYLHITRIIYKLLAVGLYIVITAYILLLLLYLKLNYIVFINLKFHCFFFIISKTHTLNLHLSNLMYGK